MSGECPTTYSEVSKEWALRRLRQPCPLCRPPSDTPEPQEER